MQEWMRGAAVAVVIGICVAPAARAQGDADAREIAAYRLTMDAVRKVTAATDAMFVEMKRDPKYQAYLKLEAEIEALEKKETLSDADQARLEQLQEKLEEMEEDDVDIFDAESLAVMEAELRKYPPLTNALRSVGMTPREYAKFFLSLLEASLVVGFQTQGLNDAASELIQKVSPENIRFVKDHEADLKALMQKWQTRGQVQ